MPAETGEGPCLPSRVTAPMRIIALIDDPPVVRRILEHLGLWQPAASERSPPVPSEAWPVNSLLPMTYHPVPDIALCKRITARPSAGFCGVSGSPTLARYRGQTTPELDAAASLLGSGALRPAGARERSGIDLTIRQRPAA